MTITTSRIVCDVTGLDDPALPLRITNETGIWDFDLSHQGAMEILRKLGGYNWVDAPASKVLFEEMRQASNKMRRESNTNPSPPQTTCIEDMMADARKQAARECLELVLEALKSKDDWMDWKIKLAIEKKFGL